MSDPEDSTGAPNRRRLIRFDPTVSTGTLLQMGLIIFACVAGYGGYQADQTKSRMEVDQLKVDTASQRTTVKEQIGELRSDVKDVQRTLVDVNQSLAVLKARSEPQERKPRP